MERRTYTVTEAATVLGISRTSAYELVRAGTLPSLRLGRRIVIIRRALEELLDAPIPDPSARRGQDCGERSAASSAGRLSVMVSQRRSRSIWK
jgi:excisionase family DNA binding protein